jgi:hypothetical protein
MPTDLTIPTLAILYLGHTFVFWSRARGSAATWQMSQPPGRKEMAR